MFLHPRRDYPHPMVLATTTMTKTTMAPQEV